MNSDKSGSTTDGQAGFAHLPVLFDEALDLLNIQPGKTYVDATAGAGGHLLGIAGRMQTDGKDLQGRLIGIDRDQKSLENLRSRITSGIQLAHANYEEIKSVLTTFGINTVSGGILADLGVSSMQLDEPERGFSFLRDGPLDMRMDPSQRVTASQLINNLSEYELAEIIFRYGEERHSRLIARNIIKARPLQTTLQLADVVARSLRRFQQGGKSKDSSHPATRTFQAIRIAVNDELASLQNFLDVAIDLLEPGARLVVITFHSLEDRLVKQILRLHAAECVCPPRQPVCTCQQKSEMLIITRKPVVANEKEVLANVRSRSAKLRAGEKKG